MPTSWIAVIGSPSTQAPRNTSDTGPITENCAAVPAPSRATAAMVKVTGRKVQNTALAAAQPYTGQGRPSSADGGRAIR